MSSAHARGTAAGCNTIPQCSFGMEEVGVAIDAQLSKALEELDSKLDGIVASFIKDLKRPGEGVVFHYTDDKGLRGVLEGGSLWLTDVSAMNDPSEIRHGMAAAEEALAAILPDPRSSPAYDVFRRHFRTFARGGMHQVALMLTCSFSTRTDDLGQWRAYADNGRGYALGFDLKELKKAVIKRNDFAFEAFEVIYDDDRLRAVMKELATAVNPYVPLALDKGLEGADLHDYMSSVSSLLSIAMLQVSTKFKHPAYKNESEIRLFAYSAKSIAPACKRRFRPYEMVRYIELEWKATSPDALQSVVIGPSANQLVSRRFAEDCLEAWLEKQFEQQRISVSTIPYRAL